MQSNRPTLKTVLDADALYFLSEGEEQQALIEVIRQMPERVYLTPNKVEFERLIKYFSQDAKDGSALAELDLQKVREAELKVHGLCQNEHVFVLDHASNEEVRDPALTVLAKPVRLLSQRFNGATVVRKGLVDVISNGTHSALVGTASSLKRCGGQGDLLCGMLGTFITYRTPKTQPLVEAIYACMVTRAASAMAFETKGHCLVTPDILQTGIPGVLSQVYRANM